MVGGEIIEVIRRWPDKVYVNCEERDGKVSNTCALYIARTPASETIQVGDSLWWQGDWAMWTPRAVRESPRDDSHFACGVDFDIRIPRVGYSGVVHPDSEKYQQIRNEDLLEAEHP